MTPNNDPFDVHPQSQPVSNPYAPTSNMGATAFDVAPADDVGDYRRAYLNHEASIKSVGLLYMLGAICMVPLGLVALFMALGMLFDPAVGNPSRAIVPVIAGLFYLGLGLFQGFVAVGLRKVKPWSRIPAAVLSAFGLLGFPVGTLISVYFLYLLLSEKGKVVMSPQYQDVIAQTPHIKYKTSIVVWILLGLVVALLGVGILAAVFAGR